MESQSRFSSQIHLAKLVGFSQQPPNKKLVVAPRPSWQAGKPHNKLATSAQAGRSCGRNVTLLGSFSGKIRSDGSTKREKKSVAPHNCSRKKKKIQPKMGANKPQVSQQERDPRLPKKKNKK